MNQNQALGLPPCSVRALLALIALVAAVIMEYYGQCPSWLTTLVATIVAFYFGSKQNRGDVNHG